MKARKKKLLLPKWPSGVSVFEVGPRDGLQSEGTVLPIAQRAELILKLIDAGLKDIEVGSFVKADRIPQLQDTASVIKEVRAKLGRKSPAQFWAFIPNEFGLNQAIENEVNGASFFIATSNTFCLKNINRTQDQILESLAHLFKKARANKIKSRVYLSTLVHCPYEGPILPARVDTLVRKLEDLGASEIVLSDTTGHATPLSIRKVLDKVLVKLPPKLFALHLHDTRGLAVANILESMAYGMKRFDSSIGGMGGCPYAPGASGNLSTEDLVYLLKGLKIEKFIDMEKLAEAGLFAESLVGRKLPSRVLRTFDLTT